jgi:hypothetical protein
MRRNRGLLFSLVAAVALAVGCSGGGQGTRSGLPATNEVIQNKTAPAAGAAFPRRVKMLYAGYSIKQHRIVTEYWGWLTPKSGQQLTPMQATPTPSPTPIWTPETTPSPGYCGSGPCFYIIPGSYAVGEA